MSRLRIFPPVAVVYPNDRVLFTAEATPPPVMWRGVSNSGDIKSDFSLEVDPAGSDTGAFGAHLLRSGIGFVELTIDDQCRPTSTGIMIIVGFINDVSAFLYSYQLEIRATTVKVFREGAVEIYTENYSTVSGDVYRLELASGFRLYRNGILLNSRLNLATQVIYPQFFGVSIFEPTAANPSRVPPLRVVGDWKLGPYVAWSLPAGGFLTVLGPSGETEFFGGSTPGAYTLIGQIEAAADATGVQRATATITIPPLQILGPTEVTLQPGQKIRFKTNYDAAQVPLVTWSVVSGGGSFTQGEFTAASTPGPAIVRATASVNNQIADIAITVPPVITNPSNFAAAKPGEQIDFDTNIPLPTTPFFHSAGSMAEGVGDVTPGLPPGIQNKDVMLLFVQSANEVVTAPAGWTAVADSPQGTGTAGVAGSVRLSVFWRRVGISFELAPTVTDPGDHAIAQILAFRGCVESGNPWDVTSGDTAVSSTSVSIPGDTTTVANCLVVLAVANATDTATAQASGYTNANLANLAERTDVNTIQGVGGGFAVATGEKAAIGAYAATTATLASASAQGRMSIALKPAVTPWSATIGSINSATGVWTAPSLAGQTAKITAAIGAAIVTIDVPVLEVFPFTDLALPINRDRNLNALIGMSEDRSNRVTREKAPPYDSYEVKLTARHLDDVEAVDAFFDAHEFGKLFILEDLNRGVRKVGWFDSPIRHEGRDECDNDLSFRFLEARL